jgi:hypothetical protein
MPGEIPILCCIDVEPDGTFFDPAKKDDWVGFESAFHFTNDVRREIEARTKAAVHFTWFLRMDEQIRYTYGSFDWAVQRYEGIFKQLMDHGDEIGLHIHPYRWIVDLNQWVQDYGNQSWVDTCVESSTAAFQLAFRHRCRSNRMGDHWQNTHTVNLLERLGIQYDLSLEPGFAAAFKHAPNEYYTGCFPDSRDAPVTAYYPDWNHFLSTSRSERSIRIIPITTGQIIATGNPLKKTLLRLLNLNGHRTVTTNLNMRQKPDQFTSIAQRHLKRPSPYLAMTIRTSAFTDPQKRQSIKNNVAYLLGHPDALRFRFTYPENAARILTSGEKRNEYSY